MTNLKPWFPTAKRLDAAFALSSFSRNHKYTGRGGLVYTRGDIDLFVFSWSNPTLAEENGWHECRLVVDRAVLLDVLGYCRAGSPDQFTIDYERDQWKSIVVPQLYSSLSFIYGSYEESKEDHA